MKKLFTKLFSKFAPKEKNLIIEKFESFLKENDCYDEFFNKILETRVDYSTKYEYYESCESYMQDLISCAFAWPDDKLDFWDELDQKWQIIYKDLISKK